MSKQEWLEEVDREYQEVLDARNLEDMERYVMLDDIRRTMRPLQEELSRVAG